MPTVLITGANRGYVRLQGLSGIGSEAARSIGLEFAKAYASSGYKTIAAVRDPSTMPKIDGVITIKLAADSTTDAATVRSSLPVPWNLTETFVVGGKRAPISRDQGARPRHRQRSREPHKCYILRTHGGRFRDDHEYQCDSR